MKQMASKKEATKIKNGVGNKDWLGKVEVASEMNCKSSGELSLKAIPRRCTTYMWLGRA